MKKFFSDFKKFITRGNIVDMAIGVIIATAFTAIVTALTNKILMPIINWFLLVITGGKSLDSIYTYLKWVSLKDADGNPTGEVDLVNSIYIDWGAFLTAIINFLLIALVLFVILKVMMSSQGYIQAKKSEQPTKEEKAQLKEQGVDMKDHKQVIKATKELREKNKVVVEPKPTTEELLTQILDEMKKQNEPKSKNEKKSKNEEKSE
ncbi:MAG: large conductance mechanosensitive channel protein MscL [Clostridia bacterium]|nr:large conductance mechanosensitive channel protein MscL [Clostridia bacterium]